MTDQAQPAEDWASYPCKVDDAPAAMFVDLGLIHAAPIAGEDHAYWVSFQIQEPGKYGLGEPEEAEQMYDMEDHVCATLDGTPLRYVGRLRNHGQWQMFFYGPAGHEAAVDASAAAAVQQLGMRTYEFGSKADATWDVYRQFIFPDPERHQWVLDHRVVSNLQQHGDNNTAPREVDHYIYFQDQAPAQACADAASAHGFTCKLTHDPSQGDLPHGLHLVRSDPVELGHIHNVVMQLIQLASQHGGEYDGWGCPIAK